MTFPAESSTAPQRGRLWHVLAAAAVSLAGVGLFSGLRQPPERALPDDTDSSAQGSPMPGYAELQKLRRGPHAGLYARGTAPLAVDLDLNAAAAPTDEDRAATRDARAQRRAYDGAPPTIPHAIDQRGFPDCLACHGANVQVGGKIATRMSHRRYDSCTQCHVVDADPRPGAHAPAGVDNTFVGLSADTPGEQAYFGAPPTIPHATTMRSDCAACHGPSGAFGLRTSHPWRQSCTQCHAPSAELDQRPSLASPRSPP